MVVDVFAEMSIRAKTQASYASLVRTFEKFCAEFGMSPFSKLTERQLCGAVVWFCRTHKCSSMKNFVAAIRRSQMDQGFGDLERGDRYRFVTNGIRNFYSLTQEVEKKLALSVDQMRAISASVDRKDKFQMVCWFATAVAWHTLLRVGEYCDGRLRWRDVTVSDRGIVVNVRFDKVKLKPRKVCVVAWPEEPGMCVVTAYWQYVKLYGFTDQKNDSPILVHDDKPLSKYKYIAQLKSWAYKCCGVSVDVVAGHSLRRGGTSALTEAGIPEVLIQHHGRWESFTNREYVEFVGAIAWQPSAQLREAMRLPTPAAAAGSGSSLTRNG